MTAVVGVGVIVFYRYAKQSAEESATGPDVMVVAPSEAECSQIGDQFARWLDTDPPITIELTSRLTVETVGAVRAGGLAFAAALDPLPEGVASYLRDGLRDYNEELKALSDDLSDGSADEERLEAVLSSATLVHSQYTTLSQTYCP